MTHWSDRINETLLDIDQWFGVNGDVIPEEPRKEIENHLRRLSEQIHGYHGFLGGAAPVLPEPMTVLWSERDVTDWSPDPETGSIPVHTFGHDAELAQRAMERRDAQTAGKVALVVIWIIFAIGVAVFFLSDWSPARAAEPVDAAIVFLVDISGTMSTEETAIARQAHIEAIASPEVLSAIFEGEAGRIAVTYVEYAGDVYVRIPWMLIENEADAAAFAAGINGTTPEGVDYSSTALGKALIAADAMFDDLPYAPLKLVVDVVGDGASNVAPNEELGRSMLLSRGATINGMPLMLTPAGVNLDVHFRDNVVGGPLHFTMPIVDITKMPMALRSKLVTEIF